MKYSLMIFIFLLNTNYNIVEAQSCMYPSKITFDYTIDTTMMSVDSQAIVNVVFYNQGKVPLIIYDTLIEGDEYNPYTNVKVILKKKNKSRYIDYITTTYCYIDAFDSSITSLLRTTVIQPGKSKKLSVSILPGYVKFLNKGEYMIQLKFRKAPLSYKCKFYYESGRKLYFKIETDLEPIRKIVGIVSKQCERKLSAGVLHSLLLSFPSG